MKQTKLIMGMPVTLEIVGSESNQIFNLVFGYFKKIDQIFSTYKKSSEISRINQGHLKPADYSPLMKQILSLGEITKQKTNGFFDIYNPQKKILDPSGIVKGWAISEAAKILKKKSIKNFYIEAGGDIQVNGKNNQFKKWRVGIRNPFNKTEYVKVIEVSSEGIATSGNYERGHHIYNPQTKKPVNEIMSLTVIGPNIYEADRFATAAFAMGQDGIQFIDQLKGFEGYLIDNQGTATMTRGFRKYIIK